MSKRNKYTSGMEDAERVFDFLDEEYRKARRAEWLKTYQRERKGGGKTAPGSKGEDKLSSEDGNKPTKKEDEKDESNSKP